ncbi:hypothetical protein B7486_46095 [cyanobacterium TDX16]|nr:hypothetical protein B7486_46095 [cyanobacterium TDX16]
MTVANKSLGELIKETRKSNYLTQFAFSKLFSPPLSQSAIARWEKGEMIPDRRHFPKIAAWLNFSLEALFELVGDSPEKAGSKQFLPEIESHVPNNRHLAILERGTTNWNRWREKKPEIINPKLAGAQLTNRALNGINLSGADLRGVNFQAANLSNANLQGADLRGANLECALFNNAHARAVDFSEANLSRSCFKAAELSESRFSHTILKNVSFSQTNLSSANFSDTELVDIDLRYATLNSAIFQGSPLKNCLIYGISAWDVKVDEAIQSRLNIAEDEGKEIYINELKLAQVLSSFAQRLSPVEIEKIGYQLQTILLENEGSSVALKSREEKLTREKLTIPEEKIIELSQKIGWIKVRHVQQIFNSKSRQDVALLNP